MAYLFETHYGKCTLADEQSGIVLEWNAGDFNASQHIFPSVVDLSKFENPAQDIARIAREMADYILENYPELV